ncbi:unnamed protein product (macronuclear) [Paramecium tetraurelia]|uniref:Uncharacterized protein n=1 Tax=Paramecium tetraurelia TaxID=5888 RepID=A0DLC1_PARTE|nr:uncharacterized protein GSPATT00018155001 [Paramecium tetraurelia]CAK83838.1 unnamed protein product [Paramecium tetraurelia]|eukprot:XP_001451235.1 hypothetical protein (macronuclear) [Paramecium tetraurelia strain d4-2]
MNFIQSPLHNQFDLYSIVRTYKSLQSTITTHYNIRRLTLDQNMLLKNNSPISQYILAGRSFQEYRFANQIMIQIILATEAIESKESIFDKELQNILKKLVKKDKQIIYNPQDSLLFQYLEKYFNKNFYSSNQIHKEKLSQIYDKLVAFNIGKRKQNL